MSQIVMFAQVEGETRIVELAVEEGVTEAGVYDALVGMGVLTGEDLHVFLEEAEEPLSRKGKKVVPVRPGARVHVVRCKRVEVLVHYLERTVTRLFPPGTRVRKVKDWAVREVDLDKTDAVEHVLQLCGSAERPPTDTSLHTWIQGNECRVCFDLVPDKKVEG